MLLDLETRSYSEFVLEFFGISKACLPEIRPSYYENYGIIADSLPFAKMAVNVMMGDQQSSFLGHWGRDFRHRAKCTFGTGAFLLKEAIFQPLIGAQYLWTILNTGDETFYLQEYPIVCAGSLVNWLKQNLELINNVEDLNYVENLYLPPEESVYFVPHLSVCLFPLWDPTRSGSFHNLTLKTLKSDLCLSVLESLAFSVRLALHEKNISILSIDGGMSNNQMFCGLLADICQIELSI